MRVHTQTSTHTNNSILSHKGLLHATRNYARRDSLSLSLLSLFLSFTPVVKFETHSSVNIT